MKIYIAGPMSGIPQCNFPYFDLVSADLRKHGYDVVSPAELDDPIDREIALADASPRKSWGDFLARDVKIIADHGVECIILLPGWEKSRGARLEAFIGILGGLKFALYTPSRIGSVMPVDIGFVLQQIQWSFD